MEEEKTTGFLLGKFLIPSLLLLRVQGICSGQLSELRAECCGEGIPIKAKDKGDERDSHSDSDVQCLCPNFTFVLWDSLYY